MDVAGALAGTAAFPLVIGIIVLIVGAVILDSWNGERGLEASEGRTRGRRILWTGIGIATASVVMFITAIWVGFAQIAGAS